MSFHYELSILKPNEYINYTLASIKQTNSKSPTALKPCKVHRMLLSFISHLKSPFANHVCVHVSCVSESVSVF